MAQTAIQLYTLREVDLPFDELLEAVAEAGFDGVEFAYRVTEEDPTDVANTLADTGLSVAGAHVGIESLEDDFEETLELYRTLGCEEFVVPWLDAEFFESLDGIQRAADRLESVESDLAEHGYTLHYHNHDHEFGDIDGELAFGRFIESTDIAIELDLGLALHGGDDPAARLRSLGDRCRLAHVKDYDCEAGESVPLGEGDLSLDECAAAFTDIDGEWFIYEYEGEDPLESLAEAGATMNELV